MVSGFRGTTKFPRLNFSISKHVTLHRTIHSIPLATYYKYRFKNIFDMQHCNSYKRKTYSTFCSGLGTFGKVLTGEPTIKAPVNPLVDSLVWTDGTGREAPRSFFSLLRDSASDALTSEESRMWSSLDDEHSESRGLLPYRASEMIGVSSNFYLSIVTKALIDLKALKRRM